MKSRSIFLLVTAAAAIAAVALQSCEKSVERDGNRITYDTMQRFLDSEEHATASRHQVVFIGLDGASWDIINPMIAEGKLPNLQRLTEEGSSGILRSVECYFSPPAWTAMITGYGSRKSGVYTFGKWNRAEKKMESVSSMDIEVPVVWDVASKAGERVGVTNVPMTYPAHDVNGIMVTGLMTPLFMEKKDRTFSRPLTEFTGQFDPALDGKSLSPRMVTFFPFTLSTVICVLYDLTDDGMTNYDTVAMKVFPTSEALSGSVQSEDAQASLTAEIGVYSPWFTMHYQNKREDGVVEDKPVSLSVKADYLAPKPGVYPEGALEVKMSPLLRMPTDPDLRLTHPETLAGEIERKFGNYIITLNFDRELIVPSVDRLAKYASFFYNYDDWDLFFYVFQAPDNIQHREGFSPRAELVYERIDQYLGELMAQMPEDATLIVASDHGFAKYKYIIDLNRYFNNLNLFDNIAKPNYDSSLVFHNQWCLYINDDLMTEAQLHRRGILTAGYDSPRDAFVAYLHHKAREIKDERTGRPMPIELIDVDQETSAGWTPDFIVNGAYTDYFVEGTDLRIKAQGVVRDADPRTEWYHDRDGIYIFWGKDIKRGVKGAQHDITDITPTILYLLGAPLATDFDGVVMRDVLKDDVLAARQEYYVRDYANLAFDFDFTVTELQSLEEKLRTLGYIR